MLKITMLSQVLIADELLTVNNVGDIEGGDKSIKKGR